MHPPSVALSGRAQNGPGTTPTYEVLALRFGTHADRVARENFLFVDGRCAPDAPMPLDFYVWLIRDDRHVLLVDTGFGPEVGARRGRTVFRSPLDGLAALGIEAARVSDVIITHMHYDHVGNLALFPAARLHVQEEELRFCTGAGMRHEAVRRPFEPGDVKAMVQRLFDERVRTYRGPAEIAPGVTVHPVGGHTPGLQVVRVNTERGWVVLASDAAHLWANIRRRAPFPIFDHLTSVFEAYDAVEALADGADHIIPGHDPQVALRFPRLPRSAADSPWVCLHEPPAG
jgi:glyoxylase-like metal-dependent hydrolase (beta-lactamase superfamily II)